MTLRLPALLCLAFGSRWALIGWGVLAFFVTVGLVGELLSLPGWLVGLSPYQHAPLVPSEPIAWGAEIGYDVIAAQLAELAAAYPGGRYRPSPGLTAR